MGKLINALRAKYDSPRAALRALGIDQRLLDPNDTDDDNETERMLLRHRGMSQADIQRLIDGHTAKSKSVRSGVGHASCTETSPPQPRGKCDRSRYQTEARTVATT